MRYKDNSIRNLFSHRFLWRLLLCAVLFMAPGSMFNVAHAQPKIHGNVYGGGSEGDTGGNTTVTVCAVDLDGDVFGGARQAHVGGRAFVHINGEKMSDDILINYVFGGNDVAGTIGASIDKTSSTIPDELTKAVANGITSDKGDGEGKNKKNENEYSAFVLTTKENPGKDYKIFIGQLFGGGNGDYDYTSPKLSDGVTPNPYYNLTKPDIPKTYIEMCGGSCAILYGGGNAVTATEATDICIDNASAVTTHIYERDGSGNEIQDDEHDKLSENTEPGRNRLKRMGIYKIDGETYVSSSDYQFSRVFGGNNKATMAIRPSWHLEKGKIRNLYSGGNKGDMTYFKDDSDPKKRYGGIFLYIDSDDMEIGNVYGGCRMSNVNPGGMSHVDPEHYTVAEEIIGATKCPKGYAARAIIMRGKIKNVYGGNDVSGTVYGGSAVGIHCSIEKDVYGGGNGSYAYTDNSTLANDKTTDGAYLYSDYYYDTSGSTSSVEALNKFRPKTEKVTIRLISDNAKKHTIIGGSVYCGGNSTTLGLPGASSTATAELKIGSYVYADNVYLGNNGANMVTPEMLEKLADNSFSTIDLKNSDQMAEYMKGCELSIRPKVVFDQEYDGLPGHTGYIAYSTYIGSLYCGGNVGSVNVSGMNTLNFDQKLVIFDKLVGGCNNANVKAGTYNAAFDGGLIADPESTTNNKLTINLSNLKIQPMRWKVVRDNVDYTQIVKDEKGNVQYILDGNGNRQLEWNTIYASTGKETPPVTSGVEGRTDSYDLDRRFKGGNIYGGCYSSGHINGNVIINIKKTLMEPDDLFDDVEEDHDGEAILYGDNILEQDNYTIIERNTGVILGQQGMDVLGTALNIFGGGKGKDTEIWGSTTINLKGGYVFQIFGGSEEGVIGKSVSEGGTYNFNGKSYAYNSAYSCTVNLCGDYDGVTKTSEHNSPDMSDCEFIYGGGFLGPICGNTTINLGKGRIFNSFAGSCNADILGHTETYMGRQIKDDGSEGEGFPYVRDYIYGGNDLGGRILGTENFSDRVRSDVNGMTYSTAAMTASAYTEYQQGYALGIFGGCFGTYDYTDPEYRQYFNENGTAKVNEGYTKPRMNKAFVNFRPTLTPELKNKETNTISEIYGSGQGYPGDGDRDKMQKSSYILIDIPQEMENYKKMEVWGAGAWSGLGMNNGEGQENWYVNPKTKNQATLDGVSAIIDLPRGKIAAAYGGSYQEGITRRTVVNVPSGSTIQIGSIFGGAFGTNTYEPCDVYESNVNWNSANAEISTAIYGGNNNERRTVYAHINVNAPVYSNIEKSTLGQIFGAGCGGNTWAEYTEVNLNAGAKVKEVYGGGQAGKVHNAESVQYYMDHKPDELTTDEWDAAWKLGGGYDPDPNDPNKDTWWENNNTNLANPLARRAEMDDRDFTGLSVEDRALVQNKYSTNVIIHKDAEVTEYAYGGGLGSEAIVSGTTYVALLGGTVKKDIYAAGTSGAVQDMHGATDYSSGNRGGFMASANVFVAGGSCRNVYGGGWKGAVGKHTKIVEGKEVEADIIDSAEDDIPAEAHVVIGIRKDQSKLLDEIQKVLGSSATLEDYGFYCGVPAIQRNAYGGGEGGAIWGTANITLNNGYIGYVFSEDEPTDKTLPYIHVDGIGYYQEKLNDETWTDHIGLNRLLGSGNMFGGGYIDNSNVDFTNVTMWGGCIRNTLFGGGEIAAIGRGRVTASGYQNSVRTYDRTYKQGKTKVTMYNGHVLRDVFGGGKGYDNLGRVGTLYTDGYVFGQTEVRIRGGEVGTTENYADGYGNVFGGGDIGYVYGIGTKGEAIETSPSHHYYKGADNKWTEDVKVVVEPYAQVKNDVEVTIDDPKHVLPTKTYHQYDYVPLEYLNLLKGKNDETDGPKWKALDDHGIIIRNAVFAGGNIAIGSDKIYANSVTIFGNVTASLRDVYRRDLITVGTEYVGGLYGGGNLSLVDGYRELHISNYGTDYYGLEETISIDKYNNELTDRERAYFRLRYTCLRKFDGGKDDGIPYKGYNVGQQIFEDEFNDLPDTYKTVQGQEGVTDPYWKLDGVCSIYAGRLLNTIQRADLVGVYGSRMVLQGARDRVTDVIDLTRYTINRVGELSLKKVDSPAGETDDSNKSHGNYFGIYNVVNYLGNLTSDVLFDDPRQNYKPNTHENDTDTDGTTSYYDWKLANADKRNRNTATCHNQVALASGVFLELTNETSTEDHKDYGYITGMVELDLINVKVDEVGGGYVYAKNEHGTRQEVSYGMVTLSEFNDDLRTYKMYTYDQSNPKIIQTSGNFIHNSKKIIIDDCYPKNMAYDQSKNPYSEAHYWYIKGSIYIYDQVISAYTGSPTAYICDKSIPLTITAGSHGQLKLLNVQPNLYAYYGYDGHPIGEDGVKVDNNSVTYKLNDVITYWDWSQLPKNEQALFVEETYVNCVVCTIGEKEYAAGEYVMDQTAYDGFNGEFTYTNDLGDAVTVKNSDSDYNTQKKNIFRSSNNISHNTGYVVSFDMDTPPNWNTWYSKKDGTGSKINTTAYDDLSQTDQLAYIAGPTFSTTTTGVYGQRMYDQGEIIPKSIVDAYSNPGTDDQATVSRAYVTSTQLSYTYNGQDKTVNPGTAISETEYNALSSDAKTKFKPAKVCINTLKLSNEVYILYGELFNEDKINALKAAFGGSSSEIDACLSDAYICEEEGLYGGTSYSSGQRYDALEGWASLTTADRKKNCFSFNDDAFDVLSDPTYEGPVSKYKHPYDEIQNVEYTAIYNSNTPLTPLGSSTPITKGDELTRDQYEQLVNEKYHYTPVHVSTTAADGDDYYIATKAFSRGNMAYAEGQVINPGTYRALSQDERENWVTVLHFTNTETNEKTYYYCHEDYTGTTSVTNRNNNGTVTDATTNGSGATVNKGWVITKDDYNNLKNEQKDFLIKGEEPTETTTLYVSRESDIRDLSKEKVITVIYQYTYNEGTDTGDDVELVNEFHIVNIHLQFESGAPIVDMLLPPELVLPGTTVGMNQPRVTPGAYELIGGGWEIYDNKTDANLHRNGAEYKNNETPMYWYQNNYWVAYYAKSYLGKTYSNPVQFSVANYHDLAKVMDAKDHHYYIDHKDATKERYPKIYINDYSTLEDTDPLKGNSLDKLKDLFDLSTGGTLTGHSGLNTSQVGGCKNLEFFLRTDLDHSASSWTPLGTDNSANCFEGMLHGDGHTITGLDKSLFSHLCGEVYNLGVTGTFTSAGIADEGTGYIENCWVKSDNNVSKTAKPLFDTPTNKTPAEGETERKVHIVNCYYPTENQYTEHASSATYGLPTKKPLTAFYNGEVTYDLNEFYLFKRYSDKNTSTIKENDYSYWKDENGVLTIQTGYYPSNVEGPYLVNDQKGIYVGSYVESRYADGDFIYQEGTIPEEDNERLYKPTDVSDPIPAGYYPIWPDDYLFFGQTLNYGYVKDIDYQENPSYIIRDDGRIVTTEEGNRVYRAPAYFRNNTMKMAHFNPYAVFAKNVKTKSNETIDIHKNMTAIDFTGGNGDLSSGYKKGALTTSSPFYPPLLDDDGLTNFRNVNLTRNLLVYTGEPGGKGSGKTPTASQQTANVVSDVLHDFEYKEENSTYHTVNPWDQGNKEDMYGHWVQLDGTTYTATRDHLLVDKEDFNAPISYTFASGKRMWYQRIPDNYVTATWSGTPVVRTTKGWDGVSLPFKVEIVTTQNKGELTHFYSGSTTGHEYWLREFKGGSPDGNVFKAYMQKPDAKKSDGDKVYTNTFLWDYYYEATTAHHEKDANQDTYQLSYYKADGTTGIVNTYEQYPRQAVGTPYLVGFPGVTYYEFDLSGNFKPQNTATPAPDDLTVAQIITFASAPGTTIGVSDNEMNDVEAKGYTYKPSYLNESITPGTNAYILNDDGDSYDLIPTSGDAVSVSAFRPYFIKGDGSSGSRELTRSIVFSDESSKMGGEDPDRDNEHGGILDIYAKRKKIVVASTLPHAVDVRIVTTGGITLSAFTVEPGETVETRVNSSGIYIVHTSDARYTTKLSVR